MLIVCKRNPNLNKKYSSLSPGSSVIFGSSNKQMDPIRGLELKDITGRNNFLWKTREKEPENGKIEGVTPVKLKGKEKGIRMKLLLKAVH